MTTADDLPTLSPRDRRFVGLVCSSWAVDEVAINEQIHAALSSGDLSIEEVNEFTLHFAVYCGWPKASAVEMAARTQWNLLHAERGEAPPTFATLDLEDLGPADPSQRISDGTKAFVDINLVDAPPSDSPYFFAGILNYVFGHVWLRPGLVRRDRRIITVACVGVAESPVPIWSHVTSALGSGDLTLKEMHDLIDHFRECTDERRAAQLLNIAEQWSAGQQ